MMWLALYLLSGALVLGVIGSQLSVEVNGEHSTIATAAAWALVLTFWVLFLPAVLLAGGDE